ncbi:hypothetical protein [Luteolibacter sp. AS25]|uniref:hypothetical protein n=1 Tax=Luteolibacter sp. AS25 TaxID=3135776 RepID=UPI00398B05A3
MKTFTASIVLLSSICSISHAEPVVVEAMHGQFLHVRDAVAGADDNFLRLDQIVAIEVGEKGRGEAIQFLVTIRTTAATGGYNVTNNLSYELRFKTREEAQRTADHIMKTIVVQTNQK